MARPLTDGYVVLRYGATGEHVRWAQQALVRLGSAIATDGIWGPQTQRAVESILGAPHLGAEEIGQLARVIRPGRAVLRELLVAIAMTQLGARETARNRGPEIDEYVRTTGLDPAGQHAWCAAYVVWCLEQLRRMTGIRRTWTRSARVVDHMRHAVVHGLVSAPTTGALAMRDKPTHMGIIVSVGSEAIYTCEGNTGGGSDTDGDRVMLRRRQKSWWSIASDVLALQPAKSEEVSS